MPAENPIPPILDGPSGNPALVAPVSMGARWGLGVVDMTVFGVPSLDLNGHPWGQIDLLFLNALLESLPIPSPAVRMPPVWGWVGWDVDPASGIGALAILTRLPAQYDDPGFPALNPWQNLIVLPPGGRAYIGSSDSAIWWAPWPLGGAAYAPPAVGWAVAGKNNFDAMLSIERRTMPHYG